MTPPRPTSEAFAPAKINLTLHVTGRRGHVYHLLDSLVAFADIGDTVTARVAGAWSLDVTGPMAAGVPRGADNLMLSAARLIGGAPAALELVKRLPVASGIGGGSADAAATLRALQILDGRAPPADVAALGADVPVCLAGRPTRMRGIGDVLDPVPPLPAMDIVLVNAGTAVPTGAVFGGLAHTDGPPMGDVPPWGDAAAFGAWARAQRNDLTASAKALCPAIADVLAALAATQPLLARMSGSGGTCFALYPPGGGAGAARGLGRPGWWVAAGRLMGPPRKTPEPTVRGPMSPS